MTGASAFATRPNGLSLGRRDSQQAVEVALRFELVDGARTLHGERLSRRHLVVIDDESARMGVVAPRDLMLRVALNGFDLVLPLKAVAGATAPDGTRRYDIVEMDARTEATLAQLVRVVLTGWLPDAEDLARGWDEETPLSPAHEARQSPRGAWRWFVLMAITLCLVGGLGLIGHRFYLGLTTTVAESAAVTAPRYDIFSPAYGAVGPDAVVTGASVLPGQLLVRVASDEIEAAIAMERADLDLAASLSPASAAVAGEAAARVAAARARLRAHERRLAALTFTSRCTCTVLWVARQETMVAPGTLLVSLVESDPDLVRVEALVGAHAAQSIRPGQRAEVRAANSATGHAAVVEAVRYESTPIPKVGLQSGGSGKVTVVLKVEDSSLALTPGTPVNAVVFK